jgi:hypothetical protein
MIQPIPTDALQKLPAAIWLPRIEAGTTDVPVYRGSPQEMVAQMASEMNVATSREAIVKLLQGLAQNRGVSIGLPASATDEKLAALFVYALLDTRLARPVPTA